MKYDLQVSFPNSHKIGCVLIWFIECIMRDFRLASGQGVILLLMEAQVHHLEENTVLICHILVSPSC